MAEPIVDAVVDTTPPTPEQTLDYLVMKFQSDIANIQGQRDAVVASNNEIIKDCDMKIAEIEQLISSIQTIQSPVTPTELTA